MSIWLRLGNLLFFSNKFGNFLLVICAKVKMKIDIKTKKIEKVLYISSAILCIMAVVLAVYPAPPWLLATVILVALAHSTVGHLALLLNKS